MTENADEATESDVADADNSGKRLVVLDVLPRGRSDDDRSRFRRSPVAFAVDRDEFRLYELRFADGEGVTIGDQFSVGGEDRPEGLEEIGEVEYEDLTSGARSELEYVVEEIVEEEADRFVTFFNEAQPVTTRLHSLDLLPGIGSTLRNNVIDARKRGPFESLADLEERVSGLHSPDEVLVERILEEFTEEDLKYRLFARRER